jgi:D-xylonolactonase
MHRDAAMTPVVWGYTFLEAPRADDQGGLYFSDIIAGGVYRWSPAGSVETVIPKRRGVGGLALHADGGLVVSGRDVCHARDGQSRQVLTVAGALGFNDLTMDAAGRVYVGSMRSGAMEVQDRVSSELWRIDAEGRGTEVCGGIAFPNGVGFAPDGRVELVPIAPATPVRERLAEVIDLAFRQGWGRRHLASSPRRILATMARHVKFAPS